MSRFTRTLLCLSLGLPSVALADACLSFAPHAAQLEGRLVHQTHIGPNEKPSTGFYLVLDKPICVEGALDDDPVADASLVQLALDQDGAQRLEPRLEQQIALTGRLMPAHSAYHFAPLLLTQIETLDADSLQAGTYDEEKNVAALPEDIRTFKSRHEACEHFIGEEPYDEERRAFLNEAVNESCTGIDQQLQDLRTRYAEDSALRGVLRAFDTLE